MQLVCAINQEVDEGEEEDQGRGSAYLSGTCGKGVGLIAHPLVCGFNESTNDGQWPARLTASGLLEGGTASFFPHFWAQ